MATTLKEYYIEYRDRIKASEIAAKSSLSKATRELETAQKDYDALTAEYADLEKKISQTRDELGTASMPSDIEALASELRSLNANHRTKRSEILDAEQHLDTLKLAKDFANAQLARVGSALTAADAKVKEAEAREDQHTEWRLAVSDGSLGELAAKAQAQLDEAAEVADDGNGGGSGDGDDGGGNGGNGNGGDGNGGDGNGNGGNGGNRNGDSGDGEEGGNGNNDGAEDSGEDEEKSPVQQAKARVEGDIPALLRTRAEERGKAVDADLAALKALIEAVENKLDGHHESTEGASGLSAKRWRAFKRAEEAFKDIVLQSTVRFEQAQSLIQTVNASTELTDAQKNRIQAVVLKEDNAILAKEKTLDEKRTAVLEVERKIELAIVTALIANIDADPEDDNTVKILRGDLETAKTALKNAESALAEEVKPTALDLWEAAVPDHIWSNLVSYENAKSLLKATADGDPDALSSAMDSAESALVSALKAEDHGLRVNESVDDRITLLSAKHEFLRNAHYPRKLGAVRGDA